MTAINQTVNVNAFYFKAGRADNTLKTFPKTVEFGDKTISFQDGLQCLIQKGQRIVRLFDMTDGRNVFRLKCEDNQWTLIGTKVAVN